MEQLSNALLKILLSLLLILHPARCAIVEESAIENVSKESDKIYVKPSDLIKKEVPSADSQLLYKFIIDYPHPHVPENVYYKPWNPVSSNTITVHNGDHGMSRILKKKNILYLSKSSAENKDSKE